MKKKRILTGIKPTGSPHLGNYLGAIRPALARAENSDYQCFYFIADYHALTSLPAAKDMKQWTYEVTATWLSFGLDPSKVIFYRQSDVPELFELQWILSCVCNKGLMNRAHAYKAVTQTNLDKQADADEGVNIGLFTYPVLMAADILAFESDTVPVGADQIQHVEIARDLAQAFNSHYKKDYFKLPQAHIEQQVKVIPGLDGRKMSKSYGNTIPLFCSSSQLKKLIGRIKTDSSEPSEPKNPDDSILFSLYQQFASEAEIEQLAKRYQEGVGWGEVKMELHRVLDQFLQAPRAKYEALMSNPEQMDQILLKGAQEARKMAREFLTKLRQATGISPS